MEEKKKRFRPTLTAYRKLESELADLRRSFDDLGKHSANADAERFELRGKLEIANDEKAELLEKNRQLSLELQLLKGRGFWKRLFNIV